MFAETVSSTWPLRQMMRSCVWLREQLFLRPPGACSWPAYLQKSREYVVLELMNQHLIVALCQQQAVGVRTCMPTSSLDR